MLFGGKAKAENVEPGELRALLDSSFDAKLGQFWKRVENETEELRRARQQFIDACDRFERIDPEPYTEDLYSVNVNFIRGQKNLYAEALKRLAKDLVPESVRAANAYEECEAVASHVERVSAELLKTNATFRLVVHCYPNHLGDFKRSFSSVERLTRQLRAELERKSREFAEYRAVREGISRFESYGMELEQMMQMINELRRGLAPGGGDASDIGQRDLAEKLSAKRAELARATSESSDLRNRIDLLAAPLERPARKFDHLSARKRQLHAFIEDPMGTLSGEAEYAEFKTLVQQLVEAVNSGAIDIKNREDTLRAASTLLSSDIRSLIASFRSVRQRRSDLEGEVRSLERTLNSLKEGKTASESAAHRVETLEKRIAETAKAREAERAAVEKLFLDDYRRVVSITK